MVSLSITKQLFFYEDPRFPIFSPICEVPKFQRTLYTFLDNCNISVDLNNSDNLISISRTGSPTPFFTIKDYSYLPNNDLDITTFDPSIKWGLG
jgi:hypothetical protein